MEWFEEVTDLLGRLAVVASDLAFGADLESGLLEMLPQHPSCSLGCLGDGLNGSGKGLGQVVEKLSYGGCWKGIVDVE